MCTHLISPSLISSVIDLTCIALPLPPPPRAMDPLSPTDDINAGWSSPTTSLRFNPPSAAEDTPPASATSNPYSDRNATASENANGFGTYTSQGLGGGAVGGDVGAGYREPVVFGAPGMGLVSPPPESQSQQETAAGAAQQERNAPRVYLRVRIGTLERNKKDLLVRFDASVRVIHFCSSTSRSSPLTLHYETDQPLNLQEWDVQEHAEELCRIPKVCRATVARLSPE